MGRGLQGVNYRGHLAAWSRQVEAYRKIGQRVSEWCGAHGIPISTYYSWQRKVFQAALSENEVCFAGVSVRPAAAETAASIQCGELWVDIHVGAGTETIRAIIRALKSC
ncbi:IS66 family insertion sequence hypothetical protein [Colidextribacter sp. OB.20]|nr:IS66 family insertion sequence hypothetical protein [Colidextribacter sp. OB.20]